MRLLVDKASLNSEPSMPKKTAISRFIELQNKNLVRVGNSSRPPIGWRHLGQNNKTSPLDDDLSPL